MPQLLYLLQPPYAARISSGSNEIVLTLFDLCDTIFFTFSNLEEIEGNEIFFVYFLKNKIKIVAVFSYRNVKLIILNDLMSFLFYYVSQLFHFDTLSFKKFILIFF